MKKPLIGIVVRKEITKDQNYLISNEAIRVALIEEGALPILLLPMGEVDYRKFDPLEIPYKVGMKEDLYQILDLCDGFILPGGTCWYELDEEIISYALREDKPLLAICLGMQALGKMLQPDIIPIVDPTIANKTVINHDQPNVDYVHKVMIKKDTLLYSIIGKDIIFVNSRHNYHIENVQDKFISAFSEDKLIEGIEVPNKNFILGIQWHPENLLYKDETSKRLIKSFIKSCEKNSIK